MRSAIKPGSASNMILEDVVAFLKKVPPFQFLEEADLLAIARSLPMEC